MGANSQNDDASWLLSQLLWRGLVISVNHWYQYWIKVMNAVYFCSLGSINIFFSFWGRYPMCYISWSHGLVISAWVMWVMKVQIWVWTYPVTCLLCVCPVKMHNILVLYQPVLRFLFYFNLCRHCIFNCAFLFLLFINNVKCFFFFCGKYQK